MWVEFVVDSLLARRGFSPGTPVFPSPQKPSFPNSNSIRNSRATGLSVARLLGVTLVKVDLFYSFSCFFFFFFLGGGGGGGVQKSECPGVC